MSHCLFISDCHLCDSRPHINQAFIEFLKNTAQSAQALYILGDFFEYWPGDDAIETGFQQPIIQALKSLSAAGTQVFFMHGNRDFLLGNTFATAIDATFLPDPSLIALFGKSILLSHGDALCTDDLAYQQFRTLVRTKAWQADFLSQPLNTRLTTIAQLRAKSELEKSSKSMQIMDVNLQAVEDLITQFNYPTLLIHGHTHLPNTHKHSVNGHTCERIVLGDWYQQGSYLRVDKNGYHACKV